MWSERKRTRINEDKTKEEERKNERLEEFRKDGGVGRRREREKKGRVYGGEMYK